MRTWKAWFIRILPLLATISGYVSVRLFDVVLVTIPGDCSFHFSLMTVNALFGGFLYTNYGVLIGVLDNPLVQKISTTDIIPKRNRLVLQGILCATISVICGLYAVLFPVEDSTDVSNLYLLMINGEIVYMLFSILYYLLSLYEMNRLIMAIHAPEGKRTHEEIAQLKRSLIIRDGINNP